MKKKRAREYHWRRQQRRKALPGFPWEGQFQTREEVEAYFAGEKIQCLLCGKWFKQISSSHLERVHEITADAYRQRYQLPWRRGLTGQVTHQKISRNAKQSWKSTQAEEFRSRMSNKRKPARSRPSFLTAQKWQEKDFDAILTRMQEQQRSLWDVCHDPDLPGRSACRTFAKQHPEFAERIKRIYASWPYSVQARVRRELSPQFRIDCQRLRVQGLSYKKIAKTLGVGIDTVFLTFRRMKEET